VSQPAISEKQRKEDAECWEKFRATVDGVLENHNIRIIVVSPRTLDAIHRHASHTMMLVENAATNLQTLGPTVYKGHSVTWDDAVPYQEVSIIYQGQKIAGQA
jgi:hypothetical protein